MRYDIAIMRDAYIKGTADFEVWKAKFEDELTGELQRNMVYLMWINTPDEVKQMLRSSNPEAYNWIQQKTSEMKEE